MTGAARGGHRHRSPHDGGPAGYPFQVAMAAAMRAMAEGMEQAPVTGDPDLDFLAMMVPHHEGAVAMAGLVLRHGRDPLVRQLAEEVVATQRAEVAAMRARLAVLATGPEPDPGGFPALSGTRGP